jgi:nucleotide-binding universal stress UspA family protein
MTQTGQAAVVVGIDESLAGLAALRYAVGEARRRGCGLRAVRAWQLGAWRSYDAGLGEAAAVEAVTQDAAAMVRRAFDSAMGGVPRDIDIQAGVVEGAVVPALIAQITSADDVLVVGMSRRRGLGRLTATDKHCVRIAPCPVVVVPGPELARTSGRRALTRAVQREARRYADADGVL